jgi:hypothetical protein
MLTVKSNLKAKKAALLKKIPVVTVADIIFDDPSLTGHVYEKNNLCIVNVYSFMQPGI